VSEEAKRQALVDSLKQITPEMRKYLSNQKKWGKDELERPDFVWHILLQSVATLGGTRSWYGLIGNMDNYHQATFDALSKLEWNKRCTCHSKSGYKLQ
jgi:hypothetical protein